MEMDKVLGGFDNFCQHFKQAHQIWNSLPTDVKQSTMRLYYLILQADRSELLKGVLVAGFSPNVHFTVDNFTRRFIDTTSESLENTYLSSILSGLQVCAENSSYDSMKVLLENGAEANQSDNTCLLYHAYKNSDYPALMLLLEYGANPDERTTTGMPLLCLCAQNGDIDFLKTLLSHGAAVHNTDIATLGNALHYAVSNNFGSHFECVKVLLDNGANANAQNRRSEAPAFLAAGYGNMKALELLKHHGGSINICNATNSTALHMAFVSGKTQCVDLLIDLIPDLNIIDAYGYTVLDLAFRFQDTCRELDDNFQLIKVEPTKYMHDMINRGARLNKFSQEDLAMIIERSPHKIKVIGLLLNAVSNCKFITHASDAVRNLPGSDQNEETDEVYLDFYDRLFKASNQPRSLQHLCRYELRGLIGKQFYRTVPQLELPLSTKKYLLLDDPCDLA